MALPHCLSSAIHASFNTTWELFASPLNSSMNPMVDYCSAFQEDTVFGAHFDAFSYRLTGSCLANPEYEPEDMRKIVLHALACSTEFTTPLFVVLILPAWEDSPWRTQSILSHPNLTTLVHLPANQLKFVPTHTQLDADLDVPSLRAADWPVEIVLIANTEGYNKYLNTSRLHDTLIPGILRACHDTTQTITLFPAQGPTAPPRTSCPLPFPLAPSRHSSPQ